MSALLSFPLEKETNGGRISYLRWVFSSPLDKENQRRQKEVGLVIFSLQQSSISVVELTILPPGHAQFFVCFIA